MGFGSWNCTNSQSEDPYAFETDDDNDCLTKLKQKHKSVTKQKKVFKNCSSQFLVDVCRPQEKHLYDFALHLSQDFLPQINKSTTHKLNNRNQVSEKPYRFFKSRNRFLLSEEKLKSSIHSKCVSQKYSDVEYSSETHCLADTENEENEKSFSTEDVALLPSTSFIKQNIKNRLTATKATASPKEENIFSSILRILPRTSSEEAIQTLNEDHTLNLRSTKQFHHQNSQMPPQIVKPFMFQKYKKSLHKKQKETLPKSNKFFKSRNRNAICKFNYGYFIINRRAHQNREKLNVEQYRPGNFFPANTKSVSNDPYSLETEDDCCSHKRNKDFKYVNTENICTYQSNRPRTENCSLSSKSQLNYPYAFEMNEDRATIVNKSAKCMAKQKGLKNSKDQFSTEVEHFHAMHRSTQSADAAKIEILHLTGKQNFVSSKMKAVTQPSTGNITSQSKQENHLPIVNRNVNKAFQTISESADSTEINLNLCGKRRDKIESSHLSPSLIPAEKNVKLPVTTMSSKKCSIAYTYLIKNTLSVVTQKRNSLKDSKTDGIRKGSKKTYGTHMTPGNRNCKKKHVSKKETCKPAHETNVKVSPVIRNLATLNIHSNLTEKRNTRATNVTNNNEESYLVQSNYTACNKTVTVKHALEAKEVCTPEINSMCLDINYLKSPKKRQSSSSCVSFIKNVVTESEISHNEKVQNHLIIDEHVSESATEIENHLKKTTEDFQFSYSSEQKDSPKMLRNTFTDQIAIIKSRHNTKTIQSHEKNKMENQMKTKDHTERENLTNPTNIKTTEKGSGSETECSAKQAINFVNKKAFLPIMKRDSSFKKRIFTSQRKKSGLLYTHKWVDNIESDDKDTKLMPSTGLLVQPVEIIRSDRELEELKSPLLCINSKHIQTTAFTNNAEAAIDLKSNEIDKYFTVIKNVRKSDQIQELGELQEFNDDVEYILDALQDSNPITTRCHSALILASKCLMPEFRMHVKAYDTMTKFFCALHDAAEDQSLALCTATIMFVLSQYEIITYMSSSSIPLLLSLLNSCLKYEVGSVQLQSIKRKVLELCTEVQSQGFVKHQLHKNITANHLASETLLNLITCDTGNLFEDHLRKMGGLKHIIMAISNCRTETDGFFVQWKSDMIDKLRFLNCCLQILECVTDQNEENQLYVLKYESSCFMATMAVLLSKCTGEIRYAHQFNGTAVVVTLEVLFTIFKILINLTHNNNNTSFGSSLVARSPEIIYVSLSVLLQAPNYVPEDKKFDLLALVLMFLINTVECNTCNRKLIFEARASDIMIHNSNNERTVKLLIELFYQQEKLARIEEFKTNVMLDDQIESELSTEPLEPSQEFIASLQEKAGQNMEYTMIASYIVLFIGFLVVDNEAYEIYIRQCLPLKSFSTMISVLEKMHNFFNMVPAISSKKDITQTQHIIQCLKQSDEKATGVSSNIHQL